LRGLLRNRFRLHRRRFAAGAGWTGTSDNAAPTFTLSAAQLAAGETVVKWGNAYYLVPEPASFALLGLGSLLLLRRPSRRRGRAAK